MLWLLLIPYCTLAFGIHGGEFITGINRQVRNVLCAAPFAIVAYAITSTHYDFPVAMLAFTLAYVGANMGFDNHPLWLKGLITLFPFGAGALPLAYWIGNRTRWTNVASEYLSGFLYGALLAFLYFIKTVIT